MDLDIPMDHFLGQGWSSGKTFSNRRKCAKKILIVLPEGSCRTGRIQLRRALLEIGRKEVCEECGLGTEWNGKPITLAIDHKDGNYYNNVESNLRFICPNCHTQTKNYGSKNRRVG